ncbi:hypothetical protein LTR28_000742, partial [Elasticomyces elasticus]
MVTTRAAASRREDEKSHSEEIVSAADGAAARVKKEGDTSMAMRQKVMRSSIAPPVSFPPSEGTSTKRDASESPPKRNGPYSNLSERSQVGGTTSAGEESRTEGGDTNDRRTEESSDVDVDAEESETEDHQIKEDDDEDDYDDQTEEGTDKQHPNNIVNQTASHPAIAPNIVLTAPTGNLHKRRASASPPKIHGAIPDLAERHKRVKRDGSFAPADRAVASK